MLPWALLLAALAVGGLPASGGEKPPEPSSPPAAAEDGGTHGPSLDQIYADYRPAFVDWGWVGRGGKLSLSLQPHFFNMAYVNHDTRVDGLIKKARELEEKREWREAMTLYQAVIDKFPDDLWPIADQGIFVPSSLYAQMRLLAMPKRELAYYRTLKDAEARQLLARAARYNSLPDYAEVVERYQATGSGDQALFILGSAALDEGVYELARQYFEQIRDYHRYTEVNRLELLLRLADCYRHLGSDDAYAAAKAEVAGLKLDAAGRERSAKYLAMLDAWRRPAAGSFEQRRSPDYVSMNDYAAFPRPETALSSGSTELTALSGSKSKGKRFVWTVPLPAARRDMLSFMEPTVAGNRIIYRYKNTLACRSLLTGEEKWHYAPAGYIAWFDREWRAGGFSPNFEVFFYPDQDVLVHDGLVFSSILKNGPSLVALDMLTGQVRWSAGSIVAAGEGDLNTRYLCTPSAGRNCIYAPYVYDDMEGDAHLSSEAGITCFESRSGKILWQRSLVRLSPRKFTISDVRRKIRVYSSPPTVAGGVLYHTTNCGVVAALDATSGQVRWIARYPHGEKIHDTEEPVGNLWANRPPLVKDGRVYVTPVDTDQLLCLDARTGKLIWTWVAKPFGFPGEPAYLGRPRSLVGLAGDGNLVVQTNYHIHLIEAATGKELWKFVAVSPHRDPPGTNMQGGGRPTAPNCSNVRPVITEDDWVFMGGIAGWGSLTWYQGTLSLRERKPVAEKWFFSPEYLTDTDIHQGKKVRDPLVNTEDPFRLVNRMTVKRYGATFEIECAAGQLAVNYDPAKVMAAVAGKSESADLYAQGELHIAAGRHGPAIELLERARSGLALEEARFRAEINQQLFRLYEAQAQAARQMDDIPGVEKWIGQMASACTTGQDEIKVLLGMAEVYELRRQPDRAARCLAAAIKHYGPVRYGISSLLLGDQEMLKAQGHQLLGNLTANGPKKYFDEEVRIALGCMNASLDSYFSIISPLEADMSVETRQFASGRLQRLLKTAGAEQVERYNREAEAAFLRQEDEAAILHLIGEYPGARASQAALDGLIAKASRMDEPERRIRLWRYRDQGAINGLNVPADVAKLAEVKVAREPAAALAPPCAISSHPIEVDPNTLLCLLKRRGERSEGESLLFMGMRSKRAHGLKFGLICWDAAAGKKLWQADELRLEGPRETGFEECFVHAGRVVVHGRSEVRAFELADGKPAWQFRVPFNFEIERAAAVEDLVLLCGRDRTLALHSRNGQVVWETAENGAPYGEPILRDNAVGLVRVNPAGVTFRSLGTGRLLAHQELPELLATQEHPVLGRGGEATAFSCDGDSVALTDGWDYIVVDAAGRKVKWQKRIENVDRMAPLPLPFRLTVSGKEIFCLKRRYDTHAVEMLDTETGAVLWSRVENKKEPVIYSAVFDAKNVYGLHFEPDINSVTIIGLDRRSGKEALFWRKPGYESPEIFLDEELHGRHLVVRVMDKQNFSLILFNVDSRKPEAEIKATGFGSFGHYGEVSYAVQDKYVGLLSGTQLTVARPK